MQPRIHEAQTWPLAVLKNLPEGIIITDQKGAVIFINEAAERLLGSKEEQCLGRDISRVFQITDEKSNQLKDSSVAQLLEGYAVLNAADGRKTSIEHASFLVRDHEGKVAAYIIVVRDISERRHVEAALLESRGKYKQLASELQSANESLRIGMEQHRLAEEALHASEARARSIIDYMLGGLITIDERGIMELVNPAAERIFGYSHEELVGNHLRILVPESAGSDPDAFLKTALKKAIGRITEWEGRRKNGEVFPFELSLFEFNTPEGRRFAGNIQDVSERREVERLKKEFVSNVSHELRTPLTSIHGSLSLLSAGVLGKLPEEAREVLSIAERNTVRLINLINDILDLDRLESGKLELHLTRVSIETILNRSIEAIRDHATQVGVPLEVKPALAFVQADEDMLVQVLVNLLSNAVRYSPAGSAVTVLVEQIAEWVQVKVVDRGRGIPLEYQRLIFERFKQVDGSDSPQKGGTGLGLAICKGIVEQHGGSIGVESEEGKGSTFWFRIPASVAPEPAPELPKKRNDS